MPRTAIVSVAGDLLALAPPTDPERDLPLPEGVAGAWLVTLADAEMAKLDTPFCSFAVDGAGVVTATVVPGAETTLTAEQAAFAETTAAGTDLATQYDTALARLDQIIGATSFTAAQVAAAVQDLARIQRRTLRLVRSALAP